jgi:hypothetical protein
MAVVYTLVSFEVPMHSDGYSSHLVEERKEERKHITTRLNELAEKGWRIVGQSSLEQMEPAKILYTLEKSE